MTRSITRRSHSAPKFIENNVQIGNMGQGGQAFVRGISDNGELTVRWFEKWQPATCTATFQLPATRITNGRHQAEPYC